MVVVPVMLVFLDSLVELYAVAVDEVVDGGAPPGRFHEVHDHVEHPIDLALLHGLGGLLANGLHRLVQVSSRERASLALLVSHFKIYLLITPL